MYVFSMLKKTISAKSQGFKEKLDQKYCGCLALLMEGCGYTSVSLKILAAQFFAYVVVFFFFLTGPLKFGFECLSL